MGRKRVKRLYAAWILSLGLLVALPLWADSVALRLKNGDKISGALVTSGTNGVVITHPVLGRLTIPRAEIEKEEAVPMPVPASPQTSQLPNAPITREASTNAPTLPAGAFNTPSAPTSVPANAKPAPKPEPKVAKQEVAKPKGPKLWNTEVQFGLNLRYATKDQEESLVIAKSTYAKPPFRHIFDYNFTYGKTEGIVSGNKMTGSEKTEFDLTKRIYLFNLAGAGYDRIRKIDVQYELSPGMGLKLYESTNFVFKSEVGFTYQDEFRADSTRQQTYSARLAELFTWRIYDKLTTDGKVEFFANLQQFGEYRLRLEGTLRYPLSNLLSFNLVVIDLYDTLPPAGVQNNDLQIRSTIGLKF